MFKYNALKLMSPLPTEADIDEIVAVMERIAWSDTKDSLRLCRDWVVDRAYQRFLLGTAPAVFDVPGDMARPGEENESLKQASMQWLSAAIDALRHESLPPHVSRDEYETRLANVLAELSDLQRLQLTTSASWWQRVQQGELC